MPVPLIATPSLLATLRTHPLLPSQSWYLIASVTLSSLNRPDEIPPVLHHALAHAPPGEQTPRLAIARRIREALVKSVPIGGLPKAINALNTLRANTPPDLLDLPSPGAQAPASCLPRRRAELEATTPAEVLMRGQLFFDAVYGKVSERVMAQMDECGTDDLGAVARLLYGYVLSNVKLLGPLETSLVILAALVAQDVNPQLKGHLKGAMNNGATLEQVRAVVEVIVGICRRAGMRRLDGNGLDDGWGWREDVAKL
ncbi:MAG: hypothetical protein M1825_006083 [Sarcosagium campestre]|nr:MAG: hypothetical protein M1825_006083 [Sarcosagium campestre]